MNDKAMTCPVPKPAAARGLGETLDDFEAGLARSVAEGSRIARLLMQVLAMLREALARFAARVSADALVADVAAVAPMGVMDVARPLIRARGVRRGPVRPSALRVVTADGVASAAVRVATVAWPSVRDVFSSELVGFERVDFAKFVCMCGQFCVYFVTISKQ